MSDFRFLCKPFYGKVSESMNLEHLIVFTRNGDRSPEKSKSKNWLKRMCVRCRKSACSLVRCSNGMLTVKGYRQGHNLAAFIKKEYYPKFNKKNTKYLDNNKHPMFNNGMHDIKRNQELDAYTNHEGLNVDVNHEELDVDMVINGYYYPASKNYAFLRGIVDALEYKRLKLHKITDLGCKKECLGLRNSLFSKEDSEKLASGAEFDRIITSFCNDVPINCSKFDCDLIKMEEYLSQEKLTFEDNLAKMREDIASVAVDFSALSQFILDVSEERDITIVSVASETIISLLAGLNTQINELIPYGGAVFIELWRDATGKEFYGVSYAGQRLKFGLFKETYIEKKEFLKFLKMFERHKAKIEKVCKYTNSSYTQKELLEYKKGKIDEILGPLIENLHRKRVLVK